VKEIDLKKKETRGDQRVWAYQSLSLFSFVPDPDSIHPESNLVLLRSDADELLPEGQPFLSRVADTLLEGMHVV